jgi:hypothetical protein
MRTQPVVASVSGARGEAYQQARSSSISLSVVKDQLMQGVLVHLIMVMSWNEKRKQFFWGSATSDIFF